MTARSRSAPTSSTSRLPTRASAAGLANGSRSAVSVKTAPPLRAACSADTPLKAARMCRCESKSTRLIEVNSRLHPARKKNVVPKKNHYKTIDELFLAEHHCLAPANQGPWQGSPERAQPTSRAAP